MGCGKSTIGRILADKLAVPFYDSDDVIEAQLQGTIAEIFATRGEGFFRQKEKEVITALLTREPGILAIGGGAFIQEEIRHAIKSAAVSVWIKVTLPVVMERLGKENHRPLLQGGNKEEIMRHLMRVRYPVYEKADIMMETKGRDPHGDADHIIGQLRQHGALK